SPRFGENSGPRARQCRLDCRDRGLRFRAVRPAGLRHVGSAAAALAAKRLGAFAGKIDRVKARYEIIGDADHNSGLAVGGNADDPDPAGAKVFFAVVREAAPTFPR